MALKEGRKEPWLNGRMSRSHGPLRSRPSWLRTGKRFQEQQSLKGAEDPPHSHTHFWSGALLLIQVTYPHFLQSRGRAGLGVATSPALSQQGHLDI